MSFAEVICMNITVEIKLTRRKFHESCDLYGHLQETFTE